MKQLVIGDFHFGKYGNNITWLEAQLHYFRNDIFGIIEKYRNELEYIVFLGDIFDIRYSTNTQVGCEIKKLFTELSDMLLDTDIMVYCVAGNHDFYTPKEEQKEYNSYAMVFGDEFSVVHPNIRFIWKESEMIGSALYCPWYDTEDHDKFMQLIIDNKPKTVYCHTDILKFSDGLKDILDTYGTYVFAGHIHFPQVIELQHSKLYNLSAALPLDFSDANKKRFIYLLEDNNIIEKFTNESTIQFKCWTNEDIFTITENDFVNANTRIYISSKNFDTAKYSEQLSYIKDTFSCNYKIRIMKISDDIDFEASSDIGVITSINNYIDTSMPKHLKGKYNYIKDKLKTKED